MLRLSDLTGGFLAAGTGEELGRLAVAAAADIADADLAVFRRPDSDTLELSNPEFAIGDPDGQRLMMLDAEMGDLAVAAARPITLEDCPASLEDRLAKQVLTARARSSAPPDLPVVPPELEPELRLLTRGAEQASELEIEENSRAASVRVRAAERVREAA